MQTCFMFHPTDFAVLGLDIQAVRLSCTIVILSGLVLLSCVALRSTWQRSPGFASLGAALSIQGGARQHTSTSRDMTMENKIDDSKVVPSFDGKLDQYRDTGKGHFYTSMASRTGSKSSQDPGLSRTFQALPSSASENVIHQTFAILEEFYSYFPSSTTDSSSVQNKTYPIV